MTLLVDATALGSGHRWRGIGNYVRHLSNGLLKQQPDSTRFLTLANESGGLGADNLVSYRPGWPGRWDDLWLLHTGAVMHLIEDSRCSIYHFTSAEASVKANGFKTVATVYDLIPLESAQAFSIDLRQIWRDRSYRVYLERLRAADRIIAISASTAGALVERLQIPPDRISVIPLGIDVDEYRARSVALRAEIRRRHRLPHEFWFTVTSPNPNKGWPDLLQAMAIARQSGCEILVAIAGYWLEEQREHLMGKAERLGVADLVIFLGYVPEEELPALYSQALGFIFPSHREGFGLPLLEAMALGTPTIASNDPALVELAESAALIFPRGDAMALADRMVTLAGDRELRQTLRTRGVERSALFTWDQVVERTVAAYRSMA